jgi:hypothetical protein
MHNTVIKPTKNVTKATAYIEYQADSSQQKQGGLEKNQMIVES